MKYTIVINQKALTEIAPDLDLVDCAILDYLYHLCGSPSEAIVKQRVTNDAGTWTWVNYAHLMADMPLLRIKSGGALSRRLQKLEASGFLTSMKGKGFRLYVRLLPFIESAFTESKASVAPKQSQLSRSANNHTTSNHTTRIIPSAARSKEINEVIDSFKGVNPGYQSWYSNKTQRKSCESLLESLGRDKLLEIVQAIPALMAMPYCPKAITTPNELFKNLPKLAAFTKQERGRVARFHIGVV